MYIHEDSGEFISTIEEISEITGYRMDVLEKDYYVTLFLQELASMQFDDGLKAYFKGGTALYKKLKNPKRFSEDIDITLDVTGLNNSQVKQTLKKASQKYVALPRCKGHKKEKNFRSEALMVYEYTPKVPFDAKDKLERFGEVQVEATTFTISEPTESMEINSLIYEKAPEDIKAMLEDRFNMGAFEVKTITLERLFVDKLFAAEAYVRRSAQEDKTFEASKHIYDLSVLSDHKRINAFLKDEEAMSYMLQIQMKEELSRMKGVAGIVPSKFKFFSSICEDDRFEKGFQNMEDVYVFRDEDRFSFQAAVEKVFSLKEKLLENAAWRDARAVKADKVSSR